MSLSGATAKLTGLTNDSAEVPSAAGDMNHDGYDDFLVGAYHNYRAYLITGPLSGEALINNAAHTILQSTEHDYTGWSVSGAGDADGDGWNDILVGAESKESLEDEWGGGAFLVMGPVSSGMMALTSSTCHCWLAESEDAFWVDDHAGCAVSIEGDMDGDGLSDILIGASAAEGGDGAAYLVLGRSTW